MKHLEILAATAQEMVLPGKGILAADESFPTIEKRFAAHSIATSEKNRHDYRTLLVTTPGLGKYISGVILFDETLRQEADPGISIPEALGQRGIIPGIKVDCGLAPLPSFPGESYTQGLDRLSTRLSEYEKLGARFTKWRAVINIGDGLPTSVGITNNARTLALFAGMSQAAGLVPIVEPEVLMTGDHTLERCEEVTTVNLQSVFDALSEYRVAFEGMLLKTSMVLPGQSCIDQSNTERIAQSTLRCLNRAVPAAVPGILFLSGGQSEIEATERLNAICDGADVPWALSISFGRALQATALALWKGQSRNTDIAQEALLHRAHCNSRAMSGSYSSADETAHS